MTNLEWPWYKRWVMRGFWFVADVFYYVPCYRMTENWWNLRNKIARFRRGYSYNDSWNIDSWFVENFVPLVEHMRDSGMGYPISEGVNTREDWEAILTEMVEGFKLYNQAYSGEGFPLPEDEWRECTHFGKPFTIDKRYHLNDEEEAVFHRSLDLFKKYFPSLWD